VNVENVKNISASCVLENAFLYGDIRIGEFVSLTKGVHCSGKIEIGDYTSISGPNTDLYSKINFIRIGKYCSIARNVSFQEYYHHTSRLSTYMINEKIFELEEGSDLISKGEIILGNDVWIGTHCVVLSGVNIGNGAVVAANSVVNKDVPPYTIVGGNPAKILGYRFDEKTIEAVEKMKWWDWDKSKLEANKHLFVKDINVEGVSN